MKMLLTIADASISHSHNSCLNKHDLGNVQHGSLWKRRFVWNHKLYWRSVQRRYELLFYSQDSDLKYFKCNELFAMRVCDFTQIFSFTNFHVWSEQVLSLFVISTFKFEICRGFNNVKVYKQALQLMITFPDPYFASDFIIYKSHLPTLWLNIWSILQ